MGGVSLRDDRRASHDSGVSTAAPLHPQTGCTTQQAWSGSCPNYTIQSRDLSFSICVMVLVWLESPGPSSSRPPAGVCRMASVAGDHFSTWRRTAPAQKKGWEAGGGVGISGSLGCAVTARSGLLPTPPRQPGLHARTLGCGGRGRKTSMRARGQRPEGGAWPEPHRPSLLE